MVIPVVAGGDHLCQDGYRVGDGSAINAAVQVAVGAGDFDLDIGKTAYPDVDRGCIEAQHGRITDEDDVGPEQVLMGGNEFGQVGTADLFFPFDNELDIGRQGARLHHGLEGLYVHIELAFVVGAAAGIYLSVPDHRFERAAMPQLQGIGRLYVVVAIDQDRGFGLVGYFLAIDDRMSIRRVYLGFVDTSVQQALFHRGCADYHVRAVLAAGADGGYAEALYEFTKETIFIFLLVVLPGFHDLLIF